MDLKLVCIKPVVLEIGGYSNNKTKEFNVGDIGEFSISDSENGIRVNIDGVYSFPYDIKIIDEHFKQNR